LVPGTSSWKASAIRPYCSSAARVEPGHQVVVVHLAVVVAAVGRLVDDGDETIPEAGEPHGAPGQVAVDSDHLALEARRLDGADRLDPARHEVVGVRVVVQVAVRVSLRAQRRHVVVDHDDLVDSGESRVDQEVAGIRQEVRELEVEEHVVVHVPVRRPAVGGQEGLAGLDGVVVVVVLVGLVDEEADQPVVAAVRPGREGRLLVLDRHADVLDAPRRVGGVEQREHEGVGHVRVAIEEGELHGLVQEQEEEPVLLAHQDRAEPPRQVLVQHGHRDGRSGRLDHAQRGLVPGERDVRRVVEAAVDLEHRHVQDGGVEGVDVGQDPRVQGPVQEHEPVRPGVAVPVPVVVGLVDLEVDLAADDRGGLGDDPDRVLLLLAHVDGNGDAVLVAADAVPGQVLVVGAGLAGEEHQPRAAHDHVRPPHDGVARRLDGEARGRARAAAAAGGPEREEGEYGGAEENAGTTGGGELRHVVRSGHAGRGTDVRGRTITKPDRAWEGSSPAGPGGCAWIARRMPSARLRGRNRPPATPMTNPEPCPQCGARPTRAGVSACEYCGTLLSAPAAAPPSPFGDLAARFAALESHPDRPALLRHEPEMKRQRVQTALSVVFLSVFIGISLVITLFFAITVVGIPLALVPLGMAGLGVWMMMRVLKKAARFRAAPLLRVPRLVIDERTHVSGGGNDSRARTRYFVTLQGPEGERSEHLAPGSIAGRMTRGDMGIAYLKDHRLLAFGRLEV